MADLIVFGEDWGGLPSSTQHLISHLMKRHRVIWVNSIGMRSPRLSLRDIKRVWQKMLAMLKRTGQPAPTPSKQIPAIIINPKVLPFHRFKQVRRLNRRLLMNDVNKAIEKEGFDKVILWLSLPTAVDMVGSLNEQASIYYCGDDFEGLDGVDHKMVKPLEQELAEKVDLILVVSKTLARKFTHPNTIILPHGVDYPLFSSPVARPRDLPENGPIAGFYGSISAWLDTDILVQSAIALPSWQFVFIGDIKTDVSSLQALPNVHFLGARPHDQLPSYIQHWNVAMLPFRNNKQIAACNPLKLREYLASGAPIASTSFPAAREYENLVAIQSPKEPFSRVILRANELRGEKAKRQNKVSTESWQHRATQLEALINHLSR
ncbi:glycosyltransferase [Endozoicomonas sp. GU-1]|uniref:glycosyltransferase n=1 Tax=Endozoicomonas sp. GU-1 TaxID=3009078 RepID=UPI0022B37681|nr:glycosyltransferase [Endozoicomonas sp. GU-1]WBA83035.1 glycosyltransferase [Endozoicomonas sp. GU-1]WBA85958.1 glycosyltransferase [Endozoicomonas sp. GU-1]